MHLSADPRKEHSSPQKRSLLKLFFALFMSSAVLLLCSCGRKGPPTLASYEKLPAPRLLGAYHMKAAVTISWTFPEDKEDMTESFVILRASDGSFQRLAFAEAGDRSYTDAIFSNGEHYRYKIVARNLRGILSNDSNILGVTPIEVPAPPKEISFAVKGASVLLSWKAQGKDVRYNVYRGFEKGKYSSSPVNASPLSGDSFTDALEITKTVYYVIRSVVQSDVANEGPASAEIAVDPFALVPSAPEGLRAFAAPDRVILYWNAAQEPWVTGFRIYRKVDNGTYALIGSTQIPTFVDMERPSTKRDYEVTAVGPAKEGPAVEARGIIYIPQE
jgi:hypothetical protein